MTVPTPPRSAAVRDPRKVADFWHGARKLVGPGLTWAWGFEVHGAELMPEGPVIVVANHASYVDPLLLGWALPRPGAFMGKQELFELPAVGAFLRAIGAFPVKRGRGDQGAVETAMAVLDAGWPLVLYPEGTRNPTGKWGSERLRKGAARIALARPVPIVPVGLVGCQDILPRGAWLPQRVRAEARFGAPLLPADYLPAENLPDDERLAMVTARIAEAVAALLPAQMKI